MPSLVLLHSADPGALFAHASAPFCARDAGTSRLPLLAVRQGGIRDQLLECAARGGSPGWLGAPVAVFGELPELIMGESAPAPLSAFERRALLEGLLAGRAPGGQLAAARRHRGFLDAVDRLFGDLWAERVMPERLAARRGGEGTWEQARNVELADLYADYLSALRALPPTAAGRTRSDGRDGLAMAAELIGSAADAVRQRLRRPFAGGDEPLTVAIFGLNDLRRGWDLLLDALRAADFVDEVRVYLPLDEVQGELAARDRLEMEEIGEHELLDQLLARQPDRIERIAPVSDGDALAPLRRVLFRAGAPAVARTTHTPVRAVAAPDMARELETVARRVKQLIVQEGAAPGTIAVVSRKSRPHGPRIVELLRRHGVPVSARLRTNVGEVGVVAALLRVFGSAATGFTWRTLAELGESPYFDLDLDAGLLKRASTRARHISLDGWTEALQRMADEAAYEAPNEHWHGPSTARVAAAMAGFAEFRRAADRLTTTRTRAEWIAFARQCLGSGVPDDSAFDGGIWGLCRNACTPPRLEHDTLDVDAARRDAEAIPELVRLLDEWQASLALVPDGASALLAPAAWHTELLAAIEDVEIVLSTPHRRGVQVLEASAAVWRTFDHLFIVGMSAGDFPAEPRGRELFAEHEREALYDGGRRSGLPLEPARVWFAREASLLRTLVHGARRSLHVSYAFADSSGSARIPSAWFDEIVSRYAAMPDERGRPASWVETLPGSRVAPGSLDEVWCAADLELFAASRWTAGTDESRAEATQALARLAAGDGERRALVQRVLAAAGVEHERRTLRRVAPAAPGNAVRSWNGSITSPELLAALGARFGDAVWSASQLELYGGCPFTFFARHVLGVRGLEEPDEEMDGATRGALLHRCLERLHQSLAADLGADALTSRNAARATHLIPLIVDRTLGEFEKTGRGGVPALRGHRMRELTELVGRYLAWEVSENEKAARRATPRRRPVLFKLAFGMDADGRPPVTLAGSGGQTLRLRGRMDRVDELTDAGVAGWRYVVDHKTSAASLEPLGMYDEGAVLQLPLYLRALAVMAEGAGGVWGGAYQIVKDDCKRAGALHPRTLDKGRVREGKLAGEQLAASRIHESVDLALRHVSAIGRGDFPARRPACAKGCPPFCEMRDVCREYRPASPTGPRR